MAQTDSNPAKNRKLSPSNPTPATDGASGDNGGIGFNELRQALEISALREDLTRLTTGAAVLRDHIEDKVEQVRRRVAEMTTEELADTEVMGSLLQFAVGVLISIRNQARASVFVSDGGGDDGAAGGGGQSYRAFSEHNFVDSPPLSRATPPAPLAPSPFAAPTALPTALPTAPLAPELPQPPAPAPSLPVAPAPQPRQGAFQTSQRKPPLSPAEIDWLSPIRR